jgi:hypothetical protein
LVNREDWLLPLALMTGLTVALSGSVNMASTYTVLAGTVAAMILVGRLLWWLCIMAHEGEQHPIARLLSELDTARIAAPALGIMLSGLFFSSFTVLKAQLHTYTADPALAAIDHALLGTDAWRLFQRLPAATIRLIYGLWIPVQMGAYTYMILSKPSDLKTRAIVSYGLIWLVLGVGLAYLIPSAGPIFYDRIYGGHRFAGIPPLHEADYLWANYQAGRIGIGCGISAMPSVHVAAAVWLALLVNRRWAWLYPAVIFIGSMMLGWHYASDGIVAGIGAVMVWKLTGRYNHNSLVIAGSRRRIGVVGGNGSVRPDGPAVQRTGCV